MARIKQLDDASVLHVKRASKEKSPRTIERERQHQAFRELVEKLTDESVVFQVSLEEGENPLTVRQRLMRIGAEVGKELAVRKHGDGFAVGLMTPERRSNRGRPRTRPANT